MMPLGSLSLVTCTLPAFFKKFTQQAKDVNHLYQLGKHANEFG